MTPEQEVKFHPHDMTLKWNKIKTFHSHSMTLNYNISVFKVCSRTLYMNIMCGMCVFLVCLCP
jgi:hypothetical protein